MQPFLPHRELGDYRISLAFIIQGLDDEPLVYMFRLNREEIHFANKLTASRISRLLPE